MKAIIVLLIISCLAVGYTIGWTIGYSSGVGWCMDRGLKFLETKNISIEVNENLLKMMVERYTRQIDEVLVETLTNQN